MATLTAIKPRPFIFPRAIVKIEIVQALPEDLKIYSAVYNKEVNRVGLIYWLQSTVTGKIEPSPRMLTNNCNVHDLKEWLALRMIWIAKLDIK